MNEKEFLTKILGMLQGHLDSFDVDRSIDYAYDTAELLRIQLIPFIEGRLEGLG